MTFIEKAAERYPLCDINSFVEGMCPENMHLERKSPCAGTIAAKAAMDTPGICEKCWNREAPHE